MLLHTLFYSLNYNTLYRIFYYTNLELLSSYYFVIGNLGSCFSLLIKIKNSETVILIKRIKNYLLTEIEHFFKPLQMYS